MATNGYSVFDDEENAVTPPIADPRGFQRRVSPRALNRSVNARPNDVFTAVPPPAPTGAEEESRGIFNPMIGAPSPAVQTALSTPPESRTLAQKKLLLDRQGTEAMSADRGGTVRNGINQALSDEQSVSKAAAQGRFDNKMVDAYTAGATNTPGATERAQAPYMPKSPNAPLSNDSLSATPQRGYASRVMEDGTVRTASGVTAGNRNVSNMQTFGSEAEAQANFRPQTPAPAAPGYTGSLTPPDPRGDPSGGLPVAQMAMASGPVTPGNAYNPMAPSAPLLGLQRGAPPAAAPSPVSPVTSANGTPVMPSPVSPVSMTPPMDDPRNPANNQAATLASSMPTTPVARQPRASSVFDLSVQAPRAGAALTEAVAKPVRSASRALSGDVLSMPEVPNPFLANRTTAPSTRIKMNAKALGQPSMRGVQYDPFSTR